MPYRRKHPTAEQQKYADKIANPKSPEDLLLALQNPASPAYKDMMNRLILRVQIYLIIEELCQKYLRESYRASEQEKAEILKQLIAKEVIEQQKIKEPIKQKSTSVSNLTAPELKKNLRQLSHTIHELENQRSTIIHELNNLKKEQEQYAKEWDEFTHQQMQSYTEKLVENKLQFVGLNDQPMDPEEVKKIIQNAFNAPPPAKVSRVVDESYRLAERTPPSPEFKAGYADVLKGVRAFGAFPENLSVKDRVKLLEKNQKPLGFMENVEVKAGDKVKNTKEFVVRGDAMLANETEKNQQLVTTSLKLEQNKLDFQVAAKQFTKVTGKSYEPGVDVSLEEKSTVTPRPKF